MSDNEKSSQLDFINTMIDDITNLYKYCVSLEVRIGSMEADIGIIKRVNSENAKLFHGKFDDIDSDLNHIFHLTYCGDNFCGNCEHCVSCPDGLYRCDLTNLELDPDSASCIRFKCPQILKSDAEICKACSDKDTPRCYKCSHFPF